MSISPTSGAREFQSSMASHHDMKSFDILSIYRCVCENICEMWKKYHEKTSKKTDETVSTHLSFFVFYESFHVFSGKCMANFRDWSSIMMALIVFTIISVLDVFGRQLLSNAAVEALPIAKNVCQRNIVVRLRMSFPYSVFINVYIYVDEYPKAGYTLFTFRECFSRNTPQNTKYLLYTFRISYKFRVLLMPQKNKPRNPLSFRANVDPGAKCEKSGAKYPRYTFRFLRPFSGILL